LLVKFNLTLGIVSFYLAKGSLRPSTFGFRVRIEAEIRSALR